ncbi:MAG: hypothetical protein K2X87_19885, partial [Gemmataceae bacterium]|nr:hypothetical protein [Gemmataceae bacterium]
MPRYRLALALGVAAAAGMVGLGTTPDAAARQKKDAPKAKAKAPPAPQKEPPATDPATMKVAKGFKVELLYSVP